GRRCEFGVGEAAGGSAFRFDIPLDEGAGLRVGDQLGVLVTDVLGHHLEGDLVQQDVVRGDLTGDHHLPHTPGGVDGELGAVTVGGLHGDGHTGDAGVDHLLHHHGHGQALVGDVVLDAVD